MNKQHIIKSFLAGILVIAAAGASAQAESDSLRQKAPGAMFGVTQLSSTAATSSVGGYDLFHTPAVNISNSLAGRLSGMTLIQGQGTPGNDNALWLIRGIGSHGYGSFNTAKIFVDGFEVNSNYFTSLSPSEIESVSVLKDGAALTIFGDRGANGAIWIQTKRGAAGPAKVSANVRGGLQMPTVINKPLDSYNYAYHYNIAASNDAGIWTQPYSINELISYQNGTGTDVDWYETVMKNSGHYVDGDVSISGGNQWARYFVALGYLNQEGLFNVKNDRNATSNVNFQRLNVRANLDVNVGRVVEAAIDLGGKLYDNKFPRSGVDNIMQTLATYPNNVYKIWDDDAQTHWSGTSTYPDNPVAALNAMGYQFNRTRILSANFTLKEKLDFITPGLYLSQAFSLNSTTSSGQTKSADYMRWNQNEDRQTTHLDTPLANGGWGSYGMDDWKQGMISAGYDQSWGRHKLNAAAGLHLSAFKGDGYFSFKYNYLNYRGRVHYNYDDRYSAELSLSTFGNDAYAPSNRWSVYPAVSGAWILSNEAFMKDSRTVNLLKIRASFGMSGASDSEASNNLLLFSSSNGRFLYKDYYSSSNPYGTFYTGATTPSGQTSRVPMFNPNPDARSETAYKYNLGVDLSLSGSRFNMTADVFFDRRKDILTYDQNIPYYYGQNYSILNIGEMINRGFEVTAGWSEKTGNWSYSFVGAVSFVRSKVLEYGEIPTKYDYNAATGKPYGSSFGLMADGLYDITDFESDGRTLKAGVPVPLFGDVRPGDIRYRDLDGSGFIDADDITQIGKSRLPEWTYSFRAQVAWKGLDLDMLLQGFAGADINLLSSAMGQVIPFIDDRTIYRIADNSWAYYPEQGIDTRSTATYPRLTLENNPHNYRASSFWMRSLDYIKIRHIELGYTFDVRNMNNLRVYVNAANPFTFSKLKRDYDIDPERLGSGYPALKTYTLGVALSF